MFIFYFTVDWTVLFNTSNHRSYPMKNMRKFVTPRRNQNITITVKKETVL